MQLGKAEPRSASERAPDMVCYPADSGCTHGYPQKMWITPVTATTRTGNPDFTYHMSEQRVTDLARAIRDWAGHQDFSTRGPRRYKNRVDALLAYKPDLSGPQSDVAGAVAELYRLQQHNHKSADIGMSPRRRDCLLRLLGLGLSPAETDENGDTMLHQLCRYDAPMADIRKLLGSGAKDVANARNAAGETPLLAHLRSSAPIRGVVDMLLVNGASPDIADNDGVTPMMALQVKAARLPLAEALADILIRKSNERRSVSTPQP